MKKLFKILMLFFSINISLLITSEKVEAQSVSFQVFYDDLSPYGNWIESPEYGYVWYPNQRGFSPYSTGGYWAMTDYGWTWVSDYSWGWAPFHYGRWYYDNMYGYVWVPGYEWGPGWVSWRRSDDYYGWAPIGPGISINVAYSNGYNIPYNNWHFVRCNEFGRRDLHNYYVDRSKNVTIINNTTVINNTRVDNARRTTYNPGPDRTEVQKRIGKPINTVAIVDEKKPAQRVIKNRVELYRPVVENNPNAEKKPAPAKITPAKQAAQNNPKQNEAINERKSKLDLEQTAAIKPSRKPQPIKQDNDQPGRMQQQQPVRKPVRDEQPVKKEPVEQPRKVSPDQHQPVQQQPQRKSREREQSPVQQQRVDEKRPVQQQPANQQPQRAQPQPEQRIQPEPQRQQPVRPESVQQPQRQNPVRQEQVQPQPQPVRQAPIRQEPMRQPPAPRQQAMPRERKG